MFVFSRYNVRSRLVAQMLFHSVQAGLLNDSTQGAVQLFKKIIVLLMRPF